MFRVNRFFIIMRESFLEYIGFGSTYEGQIRIEISLNSCIHSFIKGDLCQWRILATHGEKIILNITSLNIPPSANCQLDYLEVRNNSFVVITTLLLPGKSRIILNRKKSKAGKKCGLVTSLLPYSGSLSANF